ncbi:MAG: 6-phospho-beta-glucosidase, partial [Erysipelothrix sp.]|nr:6-phospho-beta-glucosidase [Erysipelothrix sp.]
TKMNYKVLDAEPGTLYHKYAGLNHFHWHRVWDEKGNELTDDLIERVYNTESPNYISISEVQNISKTPYNYEQIKSLGLLPCGYHRYYYITDLMFSQGHADYLKHQTRAEVVKNTEKELFELYKDEALDYKPEQLSLRGGTYYSDVACEIISAIVNDTGKQIVVSTQNKGAITDLPYDSVVEISSYVTAHGAEPIRWGHFEPEARGAIQLMKSMEELVIKAAVGGDYNSLMQAFTINPLITSGSVAKEMMDEMLVANKKQLPLFKDVISKLEEDGVEYIPS